MRQSYEIRQMIHDLDNIDVFLLPNTDRTSIDLLAQAARGSLLTLANAIESVNNSAIVEKQRVRL
jgi:hypothetical protein